MAFALTSVPLRPSSTDSIGVAIPNAKPPIEYHAAALELVRDHPWLTETGSGLGCAKTSWRKR